VFAPSPSFTAFGSPQLKAEGYGIYRRIYQRGIEYIPGLYSCDASKLSEEAMHRGLKIMIIMKIFDFLINLEN
jgi:hypothetical protein